LKVLKSVAVNIATPYRWLCVQSNANQQLDASWLAEIGVSFLTLIKSVTGCMADGHTGDEGFGVRTGVRLVSFLERSAIQNKKEESRNRGTCVMRVITCQTFYHRGSVNIEANEWLAFLQPHAHPVLPQLLRHLLSAAANFDCESVARAMLHLLRRHFGFETRHLHCSMWRRIPSRLVADLCSPSAPPASLSRPFGFAPQGFATARTNSILRMQPILARQMATASSRDVDAMWAAAKNGFERFLPKNGTPTGAKADSKSREEDKNSEDGKDKDDEKKNEPPAPHILMGAAVVALLL